MRSRVRGKKSGRKEEYVGVTEEVNMPPAVKITHDGRSGVMAVQTAPDGAAGDVQQQHTLSGLLIDNASMPNTNEEDAEGTLPPQWQLPSHGIINGPPLTRPLPNESLGMVLLRRLSENGDRAAMVDGVTGELCTSKDILEESVHLATVLKSLIRDVLADEQSNTQTREDGLSQIKTKRRRSTELSMTQQPAVPPEWANNLRQGRAGVTDFGAEKTAVTPGSDETDTADQLRSSGEVVVGIYTENREELVHALIANLLIGVPVSMLSPLSNTGELVRAWSLAGPRVVLCSWGTLDVILEAAKNVSTLSHIVVFPGAVPDEVKKAAAEDDHWDVQIIQYQQLLLKNERRANIDLDSIQREIAEKVDTKTHVAYLLQCNSGSRIAQLTHDNFLYTIQVLQEPASGYGWTRDDVVLLPVTLCHAFGLGMFFGALALGAKVVILPSFREQLFIGAIQTHKVSQVVLVPSQASLLARSPELEDVSVRGLQGAVCAAAPLPRALHRDLTRRLQLPDDARQAYGLTQASCSLLVAPRGSPIDTQGRVVPGAQAKIVEVTSREPVGPLQVGELLFRSPSIMAGYLGDGVATRDVLDEDGWLRSGDLAYYDRNNFIYVVDRLNDVVQYTRGHFKEFADEAKDD